MTATKGTAIASLVLITSAFAQDSSKKPKVPVKPPTQFAYLKSDSMTLQDEGCLKDYVRAQMMEGIAKRKLLKELMDYGCLVQSEYAGGRVMILDRRTITVGTTKVVLRNIGTTPDESCPECDTKIGMVLESALTRIHEGEPSK